jgi:single-stranded-DNA-specific exonuclease
MVANAGLDWLVAPEHPELEFQLVKSLGIEPITAKILVNRGIVDPVLAERFLSKRLEDFHDPALLPDFELAANEILGAKERSELIYVHGDYDADGITSVAIFGRFFDALGFRYHLHVPHRIEEGYGIDLRQIQEAKKQGASLFLTCDCGISAFDQIAAAKEAGLRVLVTDHHQPKQSLPDAVAIVNPMRHDSNYPWKSLCGAGVVFKLCMGLAEKLGYPRSKYVEAFSDLAAIGTVADMMPLLGENRLIAQFGLQKLAETKKLGLIALIDTAGIKRKFISASTISFQIAPRLNATGRIDSPALGLELLLTKDAARAKSLVDQIEIVNERRKQMESDLISIKRAEVEELVSRGTYTLFVGGEDWHPGVVGLVAGKLQQEFHRPSFVFSAEPNKGIGKFSARSIRGFDLAQMIESMPDLLVGGGHASAAGASFDLSRVDETRARIEAYAQQLLKPEDLVRKIVSDLEIDPSAVNLPLIQELCKLAPHGIGNPSPTFVSRGLNIVERKLMSGGLHIKWEVRRGDGSMIDVMAWRRGEELKDIQKGSLDVVYTPGINEFNGKISVQFEMIDFRWFSNGPLLANHHVD